MSKHFELIEQMEKENSLPSGSANVHTSFAQDGHHDGARQRRWANDESLRLVQQVFLSQSQTGPRVVVFAGVEHGNGCSQICASVAETLARTSLRPVCLVEANFRSPSLPEMFGTTNHYGLTEALLSPGPITSFAKQVSQNNLWLLSSGTLASDAPSLLSGEQLRNRVNELRLNFDFVIIDAPPLTQYSDAVVLGQLSDGLVLVIEAESTRREAALAVVSNIRSVKVPVLAAVLNKRKFPIPSGIYDKL
jgi:capsular exopolysaccharide synthesis family protein